MTKDKRFRSIVNKSAILDKYPTHMHEAVFWESLGRAVATFGFLEEVLAKAIFLLTGTKHYSEQEIEQAYSKWLPLLEKSLADPLGNLIDTYGKAVRDNPDATIENLDERLKDLREASKIRNVLCHGSWKMPDSNGASIPFFVNRQIEEVVTPINYQYINQVQRHSVNLISEVINTVTHMGWQFPGSNSPGEVWNND